MGLYVFEDPQHRDARDLSQKRELVLEIEQISVAESSALARVVVLGCGDASLQSLRRFFIALDDGGSMAYVVTQHAQQDHTWPDALRELTDLPVIALDVAASSALEPDHVYVAAPGCALDFSGDRVHVTAVATSERASRIDHSLRSLAHSLGQRAVAIVLPGTGSDGALGVQAVARVGGATFAVQPERDDVSSSMPDHAIATGAVQHVLSPFQLAQLLCDPAPLVWPHDDTPRAARVVPPTREELERENAALRRQNRQLFAIHGRLQKRLLALGEELEHVHERNTRLSLTQLSLSDLLSNGAMSVLSLDERFCVQGFAGEIERVYHVTEHDIGRPIMELEHRAQSMPLLPPLHEVMLATRPYEHDVVTADRWFVRRMLLQGRSDAPTGIVLVFIDVTKLKEAEAMSQPHDDWVRRLIDASPSLISFVDDAIGKHMA